MKKILLLTNSFSPINSPASHRYNSFAKYLAELGYEVIVLTPKWTQRSRSTLENKTGFSTSSNLNASIETIGCRVERVPFRDGKELDNQQFQKTIAKLTLNYVTYSLGNLKEQMLKRAAAICKKDTIDLIISGGVPEYITEISSLVADQYNIPWISEYRDVVGQTPIQANGLIDLVRQKISRKLYISKDNKVTKTAVARITVSQGLADILLERNKSPVHVVMNGFESDDFDFEPSNPKNEKLTIIYGGTIYPVHLPDVFIQGLKLFIDESPALANKILVKFFGQSATSIQSFVANFPYNDVFEYPGNVERKALLQEIDNSDILLFLSTPAKGIATSKIFECLASTKNVLSVPGDKDITSEMILKSKAGLVAETPQAVKECLESWMTEWLKNGYIKSNLDIEYIKQFSRKEQAKKLAKIIDAL